MAKAKVPGMVRLKANDVSDGKGGDEGDDECESEGKGEGNIQDTDEGESNEGA